MVGCAPGCKIARVLSKFPAKPGPQVPFTRCLAALLSPSLPMHECNSVRARDTGAGTNGGSYMKKVARGGAGSRYLSPLVGYADGGGVARSNKQTGGR